MAEKIEAARLKWDLMSSGVLDPDQPTPWSDAEYTQNMESEFTKLERRQIRYLLRLLRGESDDG